MIKSVVELCTPIYLPREFNGQRKWWARVHGVTKSWLFILLSLGGLSAFWQFVEFSLLCSLLAVGGVVHVACQDFLVREACVGVLVGGAVFLLSGVQ